MSSEYRKPGVAAGLDAIMPSAFDLPVKPVADMRDAARAIRGAAAREGKACGALWLSDAPVHRGGLFNSVGRKVEFPSGPEYERCFVALVDPEPTTRWAHPAFFAFVPADGKGAVRFIETDVPERAGGAVRLLPAPEDDGQ